MVLMPQKTCSKECSNIRKSQTDKLKRIKERACKSCGKKYVGTKMFCSDECKHNSLVRDKKSYSHTCVTCGTEYKNKQYHSKYCSNECKPITVYKSICKQCGRTYNAKYKKQIFCSVDCLGEHNRKRAKIKCQHCGELFNNRVDRKFCSRECAFKYRYDKNSIIKKCKYCNNTFKGVTRDVFCSNDCKLKHFEDKKKRKLNKSLISLLKKRITKLKSEEKERQRIQIKTKVCKYCGSNFISVKGRLFCSETCSKKFGNKQKEIRRYKRLHENGCVDNSITLRKLYYKFDGVCQLCGEIVDYNDYLIDEKGSFIAGENYPSVDHIYPVSCGGTHTWDNVQLSHRRCNTLKSNKFKED